MELVRIVFDTDIGGDCDDAGTLALLHRLCDKGEAELLAVTHCRASAHYAGCIDAINQFYGRKVPIGLNYDMPSEGRGIYAGLLCDLFPNDYPPEHFGTPEGAQDTLQVLRKTLADVEDGTVTLVVTGALNSMARLLKSGPDAISELTGKELIEKKIARTVIMGGRFLESWPMPIHADDDPAAQLVTWEWNIRASGPEDMQLVCDRWPGELVYSSYEIGTYIVTLKDFPSRARKGDPVAAAYEAHNWGRGRCSWDLTAMLEAVRPGVYWNYHEFGKITVDEEMVTHWQRDMQKKHTYLLPKVDYEEIRQVIDDLVDGK